MFISLSALSLCDEGYYIRYGRLLQGVFKIFLKAGAWGEPWDVLAFDWG